MAERKKTIRRRVTVEQNFVEKTCDQCGTPYWARRSTSRFCSPQCKSRFTYLRRLADKAEREKGEAEAAARKVPASGFQGVLYQRSPEETETEKPSAPGPEDEKEK
jgi:uncharacterized Zn finger protein (UPF0148 family)